MFTGKGLNLRCGLNRLKTINHTKNGRHQQKTECYPNRKRDLKQGPGVNSLEKKRLRLSLRV